MENRIEITPYWRSPLVGTPLLMIGLFFVLREARPILLPVAVAIVLTFVLAPAVRRLRRRGVPEAIGAGVLIVSLFGVIGLSANALSEPVGSWVSTAPATFDRLLDRLDRLRANLPLLAPATTKVRKPAGAQQSPPTLHDPLREHLASESMAITRVVAVELGGMLFSLASTSILLYFLLASEHWLLARSVEAIPGHRARARLIGSLRSAQRDIGHYLATAGLINLCIGALVAVAMSLMGLPNPMMWGAVAAIFNFIPYLGPLFVFVLLMLAGVQSFDALGDIVAPALVFGLIHVLEGSLITPWLIGRRLALSSISVFLSVMFWGWLWGIGGALIAVPILIGARSVCKRYKRYHFWCAYLEPVRREPSSFRALLRFRRTGSLLGSPREEKA